jgi:hypothetical protein
MKRQVIQSSDDLDRLESLVSASAKISTDRLRRLLDKHSGINALAVLRFAAAGCDPLDGVRPLNVIEQLNQSFTYLASIAAARWLLERYPNSAPLVLNLGTTAGTDIASADGSIAAETFAATDPESNDKLRKDIAKVAASAAAHKFVFFLSPSHSRRSIPSDVTVVRLDHAAIARLAKVEG